MAYLTVLNIVIIAVQTNIRIRIYFILINDSSVENFTDLQNMYNHLGQVI